MARNTIPDVPEEVRYELGARAAPSGRSLQECPLIELAGRRDVHSIVDRKRRASTTLPASRIIEHRDAGRR